MENCIELKKLPENHFESKYYGKNGISLIPKIADDNTISIVKNYGVFAKWVKLNKPEILVNVPEDIQQNIDNNSIDIFMPLIHLASDIALQVAIELIVDYIKDTIKGKLRQEPECAHVEIEYFDEVVGKNLKFKYEGSIEGLEKSVEKFDVTKLLER